ncbi:MAG TPA: hypothetical protein VGL58_06720 [Caulobacteraceae bacterium]|jgi:hypothetical protein
MAARLSRNSKTAIAAATLVVIATGAYVAARLIPPQGAPTQGTIAPQDRLK